MTRMKVTAIVQARMGSTRLPGKVLMDLGGWSVLSRVVRRLGRAKFLQQIVVATSVAAADDAVAAECVRLQAPCYRGSEDDVLDRYYQAAKAWPSDAVVRITADCPLIDPEVVGQTIEVFLKEGSDYASNSIERSYPRGLDAEVFTVAALQQNWQEAREPHQREHVTPFFYEHPERFRISSIAAAGDHSRYRLTLDTADDLRLIRAVYASFGDQDTMGWREVVALLERRPELAALNSHVVQKTLHEASPCA
jgi:spore coat polysaccharide biosynthesis protein SpsF